MTLLERLRELDKQATKGPWLPDAWTTIAEGQGYAIRPFDSALISEARNALPVLLAFVEAAQKLRNEPAVRALGGTTVVFDFDRALAALTTADAQASAPKEVSK